MKKNFILLFLTLILFSNVSYAKKVEYTIEQLALQKELRQQGYSFKPCTLDLLIKDNKLDIIKKFLDAGYNTNLTCVGYSSNQTAVYYSNLEALKIFTEHGADINCTSLGTYLLDSAIYGKKIEIVKYLYNKGAKYSSFNEKDLKKIISGEYRDPKSIKMVPNDFFVFRNTQYEFVPLVNIEINGLNKEQKKEYKKILKASEYITQARKATSIYYKESCYLKALNQCPDLNIALFELGKMYYEEKYFSESNVYLERYVELNNEKSKCYSRSLAMIASNYFELKNYKKSLELAKNVHDKYSNTFNKHQVAILRSIIARSAFLQTDSEKNKDFYYRIALEYANKNINCHIERFVIEALKLNFSIYYKQNKKTLAYQEAKKLVAKEKNSTNFMALAVASNNNNERLKACYEAKKYAITNKDFSVPMKLIAEIETKKLDRIVKNLGFYAKTPDWNEIMSLGFGYGSVKYWSLRQDKFYNSINSCIKNYSGRNLAACFDQVLRDEDKETEYLRINRILASQAESNYLRSISNMYLSEISFQQQMSNYYQSQIVNQLQNINNW